MMSNQSQCRKLGHLCAEGPGGMRPSGPPPSVGPGGMRPGNPPSSRPPFAQEIDYEALEKYNAKQDKKLRKIIGDLLSMSGVPPADDETYSGGKQARAQTAVEPGDESVRNLRDMF